VLLYFQLICEQLICSGCFRLLQFNLFNSTNKPGEPDSITLYDGDIYNVTSTIIAKIEFGSHNERRLFRTKGPSLSVKLFATGASSYHGFIAEIVTLPISAIGFSKLCTILMRNYGLFNNAMCCTVIGRVMAVIKTTMYI